MKALKIIGIILAVIAALFYGGSFMFPAEYGMQRSVTIKAPSRIVFEQVNNLEKWPAWSPWSAMDPEMKVTYTDKKTGEGAQYSWVGPETGTGSLVIIKSTPYTAIETNITFEGSEGIANGNWTFDEQEGTTTVTWKFSGTAAGAMERYMGAFMDSFLGPAYEQGLNRMKEISEALYAAALEKEALANEAASMEGDGEEAEETEEEEGN